MQNQNTFTMHEDEHPVLCPAPFFRHRVGQAFDAFCSPANSFAQCESSLLFIARFLVGWRQFGMFLCSVNPFNLPKKYGPRWTMPGNIKDFQSSLKTLSLAIGF